MKRNKLREADEWAEILSVRGANTHVIKAWKKIVMKTGREQALHEHIAKEMRLERSDYHTVIGALVDMLAQMKKPKNGVIGDLETRKMTAEPPELVPATTEVG